MSFLRISLITLTAISLSISGFSQQLPTDGKNSEEPREKGLRKVASGQGYRDMEMNIHIDIDHEAINENIAMEVENAMRSLETNLENFVIHIEPIEINLHDLDMHMGEFELNLSDLDFDIEPIDIDLDLDMEDDFEMEINSDHYHDRDDREGDDQENESQNEKNERSKGLKKVN